MRVEGAFLTGIWFACSIALGLVVSAVFTLLMGFVLLPGGDGVPGDGLLLLEVWIVSSPLCVVGTVFAAFVVWRKYFRAALA